VVVVLDTAGFISGMFWRTEAHEVLRAFAEGRISLAYSRVILDEYAETAQAVRAEERLSVDPQPWLAAIAELAFEFEPTPLPDGVCRDEDDDKFIACALAASADALVTRDQDLLALHKPFGVPVLTPRQLLSHLAKRGKR
jgi:putative PIN family toxin of toxin-antitoxin system